MYIYILLMYMYVTLYSVYKKQRMIAPLEMVGVWNVPNSCVLSAPVLTISC